MNTARDWWFNMAVATAIAVVACGGGGGASPAPATSGTISLLAGSTQHAGSLDGVGAQAQFNGPRGVAQDASGTLYVADTGNHTIRKITASGAVSTFAGTAGQAGSTDGTGAAARFNQPEGLVVGAAGEVYVADAANHTIRRISPSGVVTTLAGAAGQAGAVNGVGVAARFTWPSGVALDAAGNLFVADRGEAVRKVAPDGSVTNFAVIGFDITGVAVSAEGVVYVSQANNFLGGRVSRFDSQGRAVPWGSLSGGAVWVAYPEAIAASAGGELVVANSGIQSSSAHWMSLNNSIVRITSTGNVVPVAGKDGWAERGDDDGVGTQARFNVPQAVAVGNGGRIFVADTGNHAIRQIDAQGVVSTLAGGGGIGRTDGQGSVAQFSGPTSIVAGADGNLYVSDTTNGLIRRVSLEGNVSTLPNTWPATSTVRGCDWTSSTDWPLSFGPLAIAADGTLYVVNVGYFGPIASYPVGVIDPSGNCRLEYLKGYPYGIFGMAVGTAGLYYAYSPGEGMGAELALRRPGGTEQVIASSSGFSGIVIDARGTVFATGEQVVSAIDPQGGVRVIAGKRGEAGHSDGSGEQALFNNPGALAIDDVGNLYVADATTIRKITPDGQVSTVAGTPGQAVATAGPLPGSIGQVKGLAWRAGMLYATVENAVWAIGPVN